jgi:hypothetical protein
VIIIVRARGSKLWRFLANGRKTKKGKTVVFNLIIGSLVAISVEFYRLTYSPPPPLSRCSQYITVMHKPGLAFKCGCGGRFFGDEFGGWFPSFFLLCLLLLDQDVFFVREIAI